MENHGQIKDRSVKFYAETRVGRVFVTDKHEIVYGHSLRESVASPEKTEIKGARAAATRVNSYIGGKDAWQTNIGTWQEISMGEVYKGIDLTLKAYGNNVEKVFTVHPRGPVDDIRMRVGGARRIHINDDAELEVETEAGVVRYTRPVAYQETDGKKVVVEAEYRIVNTEGSGRGAGPLQHDAEFVYAFHVGTYDRTRPLVIDPVLSYSTYLGGSALEEGTGLAVDALGNAYVTGRTDSADFPLLNPRYHDRPNTDAFATKLDPDGALVYSTYLGGDLSEIAYAVAVDSSGNAYLAGYTSSTNFPVLNPIQASRSGTLYWDVFVTKIASDGGSLVYSTYLGGTGAEEPNAITVDLLGNAYVTGRTNSTNFPVVSPFQTTLRSSSRDVFVSKINP